VLICAPCCGSKRRVEIDCPDDCVYLTGAHAQAWDGRETERRRDLRRVAAHIHRFDERQAQLFGLLAGGVTALHRRSPDLDDALLASALAACRKTVETRLNGVLYEHRPDDLRAVELIAQIEGLFEAEHRSGQKLSPSDRDLLPVLAAVEAALDETRREAGGPTAFLDTLARLSAGLALEEPRRPTTGGLIVAP
jgi:hypothetical protein